MEGNTQVPVFIPPANKELAIEEQQKGSALFAVEVSGRVADVRGGKMRRSILALFSSMMVLLASVSGCSHGFEYTLWIDFPTHQIRGEPSGVVSAGPPTKVTITS